MSAATKPADPLRAAAAAAGAGSAWLVGGAVRDRLLAAGGAGAEGAQRATASAGEPSGSALRVPVDHDVIVDGDPRAVARAVGRATGGHVFPLSDAFGAWRVVARDHVWQLDVLGLDGETLAADLGRRDLTINAIAQPLDGGPIVDPYGGARDIARGRLAMVSDRAFADDPLRVMRLARFAAQLGFLAEDATVARACSSAPGLAGVAPERVFAELRALLAAPGALDGLVLLDRLGATAIVLPELAALDGVQQSRYHHLDVAGHTREVLAETIALTEDPGRLGLDEPDTAALAATFAQPLTGEATRGEALRLGALLHDIAKPTTRAVTDEGRVTFMDHDRRGAELARVILGRLRASERLTAHVAALTRHHLRLGFLVHRMPLSRREIHDYLHGCEPVEVDVSVLSVADRLATRGDRADVAIARHLELARGLIGAALAYEAQPPRPPIRGDALASALGIVPGPELGEILAELTAATYAGEVTDADSAIAYARRWREPGLG